MGPMRPLLLAALLVALTATAAVTSAPAPARTADSALTCIPDEYDSDCDGVHVDEDNCPQVKNADQLNRDGDRNSDGVDDDPFTETDPPAADGSAKPMPAGDGAGDPCDQDDDADGVPDFKSDGTKDDLCRLVRNPDQLDSNQDRIGEDPQGNPLCAPVDRDGDTVEDDVDNCPGTSNPDQADNDADRRGDLCDPDDDGDGVFDTGDNCPYASNPEQTDNDGDGIGGACDPNDRPPAEPGPAAPGPGPGGTSTGGGSSPGGDSVPPDLSVRPSTRAPASDLIGGLPTSVSCDEACGLQATITLSSRDARRLRTRRTIATADGLLGRSGRTYLIFRLRRGVATRLKRLPRAGVTATLRVVATDSAANRTTRSRRVRIRR